MKRANWTNTELNAAMLRRSELAESDHHMDCACNDCIEYYRLDYFIDRYSRDEKAGAVIAIRNGRGDEPILENEFIRL